MHVQFANPWLLTLLWLVPVAGAIWLAAWHMRKRILDRFVSSVMRQKLCPPPRTHRFYWQWSLILIGLLLGIIAAARPQWGLRAETVMQHGRDLIIALDVSRSMLAQDVHPDRLQRSKADIQDLLRELRGDRAALIAFRGKATLLCPLTTDYAYLEQALDDISPESAPRGETDIGDAITKSLEAFESDAGAYQAIILISDGEDLAGNCTAAAENARKKGIVIFTVGLGDPQGAKIPSTERANEFMTYQGKDVVSKLQHETLKSIAAITGGAYVPVGTANVKLGKLYHDHLSKLSTRDIAESIRRRYIERYQWFLLPAILAWFTSALLSRGKIGKRIQATPVTPVAILRMWPFIITLALVDGQALAQATQPAGIVPPVTNQTPILEAPANASSTKPPNTEGYYAGGRDGARHAQRLYQTGNYAEAAQAYLSAMPGQTRALQNDCLYNAGIALFRAGKYQSAADKFTELTTRQPPDPAAAFYNLGCSTFQLAEQVKTTGTNVPSDSKPALLEHAGLAFQRTLRHADSHVARDNLGTVVKLLPKAREAAKLQALMAHFQGVPTAQMADTLLMNQRKIIADLPAVLTNATPSRIAQMEALGAQQRDNADILIPLKISILAAMEQMVAPPNTGVSQATPIGTHIEAVRNTMQQAAESLRNIENEAYGPVSKAETGVYNLWKGIAQFPQLLREDIFRQTNAINQTIARQEDTIAVKLSAIRDQQNEAQELTRLFVERFAKAATDDGAPPAGGRPTNQIAGIAPTNAPDEKQEITEAIRTNILALAQQALMAQSLALGQIEVTNLTASLSNQQQAHDLLKEIEKLLPKNKNRDNSPQNQPRDQPHPDQPNQDQPKPEQPPENKPENQQPQQPPEAEPKHEQPDKGKEMTPEQARILMEKASQREKDHRKEREQDRYVPPSPVERDW